jgi:hypothetical protein
VVYGTPLGQPVHIPNPINPPNDDPKTQGALKHRMKHIPKPVNKHEKKAMFGVSQQYMVNTWVYNQQQQKKTKGKFQINKPRGRKKEKGSK